MLFGMMLVIIASRERMVKVRQFQTSTLHDFPNPSSSASALRHGERQTLSPC